jgi:hypothetical protein
MALQTCTHPKMFLWITNVCVHLLKCFYGIANIAYHRKCFYGITQTAITRKMVLNPSILASTKRKVSSLQFLCTLIYYFRSILKADGVDLFKTINLTGPNLLG